MKFRKYKKYDLGAQSVDVRRSGNAQDVVIPQQVYGTFGSDLGSSIAGPLGGIIGGVAGGLYGTYEGNQIKKRHDAENRIDNKINSRINFQNQNYGGDERWQQRRLLGGDNSMGYDKRLNVLPVAKQDLRFAAKGIEEVQVEKPKDDKLGNPTKTNIPTRSTYYDIETKALGGKNPKHYITSTYHKLDISKEREYPPVANRNYSLGVNSLGNSYIPNGLTPSQGLQEFNEGGDVSHEKKNSYSPLIEVEGGETVTYKVPNKDKVLYFGEFQGPSHEGGGIKTRLPAGSTIHPKKDKYKIKSLLNQLQDEIDKDNLKLYNEIRKRLPDDVKEKNTLGLEETKPELSLSPDAGIGTGLPNDKPPSLPIPSYSDADALRAEEDRKRNNSNINLSDYGLGNGHANPEPNPRKSQIYDIPLVAGEDLGEKKDFSSLFDTSKVFESNTLGNLPTNGGLSELKSKKLQNVVSQARQTSPQYGMPTFETKKEEKEEKERRMKERKEKFNNTKEKVRNFSDNNAGLLNAVRDITLAGMAVGANRRDQVDNQYNVGPYSYNNGVQKIKKYTLGGPVYGANLGGATAGGGSTVQGQSGFLDKNGKQLPVGEQTKDPNKYLAETLDLIRKNPAYLKALEKLRASGVGQDRINKEEKKLLDGTFDIINRNLSIDGKESGWKSAEHSLGGYIPPTPDTKGDGGVASNSQSNSGATVDTKNNQQQVSGSSVGGNTNNTNVTVDRSSNNDPTDDIDIEISGGLTRKEKKSLKKALKAQKTISEDREYTNRMSVRQEERTKRKQYETLKDIAKSGGPAAGEAVKAIATLNDKIPIRGTEPNPNTSDNKDKNPNPDTNVAKDNGSSAAVKDFWARVGGDNSNDKGSNTGADTVNKDSDNPEKKHDNGVTKSYKETASEGGKGNSKAISDSNASTQNVAAQDGNNSNSKGGDITTVVTVEGDKKSVSNKGGLKLKIDSSKGKKDGNGGGNNGNGSNGGKTNAPKSGGNPFRYGPALTNMSAVGNFVKPEYVRPEFLAYEDFSNSKRVQSDLAEKAQLNAVRNMAGGNTGVFLSNARLASAQNQTNQDNINEQEAQRQLGIHNQNINIGNQFSTLNNQIRNDANYANVATQNAIDTVRRQAASQATTAADQNHYDRLMSKQNQYMINRQAELDANRKAENDLYNARMAERDRLMAERERNMWEMQKANYDSTKKEIDALKNEMNKEEQITLPNATASTSAVPSAAPAPDINTTGKTEEIIPKKSDSKKTIEETVKEESKLNKNGETYGKDHPLVPTRTAQPPAVKSSNKPETKFDSSADFEDYNKGSSNQNPGVIYMTDGKNGDKVVEQKPSGKSGKIKSNGVKILSKALNNFRKYNVKH